MAVVYLSLGSNLGERERMLETAVGQLAERAGEMRSRSSVYETEPWGVADQPLYLNCVISMETRLRPLDLLDEIHAIEQRMGRSRNGKPYQPRTIDIDILFYDQLVFRSLQLTIPHPLLHRRSFILVPLMEIAPELMHPLMNRPVKALYAENQDPLTVRKYNTK